MGRRWLWIGFLVVATWAVPQPSFAATPSPHPSSVPMGSVGKPGITEAQDEPSARLAARQTGQRIEVTSHRTEKMRVFANPSGTMTVEEHTQPFQVRRGAGWVPVDTNLQLGANATVSPVATVTDLVLSGGGSGPLARLGHNGQELSLSWPAALKAPSLAGDTATYAEVLPGVDLAVRATPDGLAELLIVKTRQAAQNPALARVRFTTTTKGLTLSAGADGGLVAKDARGGIVFSAAAPSMWETAGPNDIEPRRAPVRLEVGSGELRVVPDQRMLTNPTMRFPLTIDPFVSLGLRQWGNITANAPNQGIAADPFRSEGAKAGYACDYNGCYLYRSVFAFWNGPFNGSHVLNATFGATLYHSWSCSDTPVELWWTGAINDGSSWNNTPFMQWLDTRSAHAYNGCGGPVRMLFGNGLTGLIQNMANGGWSDVTVGLKAPNEGDVYQWKRFFSDVSLSVEYNFPPNQPTGLDTQFKGCTTGGGRPFLGTTTPRLSAFVSDRDGGDLLNAAFEFWTIGGAYITTVWQNNVGNNSWAVVNAPAGALADGGTYKWHVVTNENLSNGGVDWSPWSGWCEFSVDATPPNQAKAVTSTDYPNDGAFHGSVGRTGLFTLVPPDLNPGHVAGYLVGLNQCTVPSCAVRVPAAADHSGSVYLTPNLDGRNTLSVWTLNFAGLSDAANPLLYSFLVRSGVGPAGNWPMNDGAGTTAKDFTNHGNDATLVGGASWTAGRSNVGSALALDGSSGYAATAGTVQTRNPDTGAMGPMHTNVSYTVAAWVKPSTVNGTGWYPTAVSSDGNRASAFFLRYSWGGANARWRFDVTQSDVDNAPLPGVAGTSPVQTDRWTFVAGTYDSASQTICLYVNGLPEPAQPAGANCTTIAGTFDSAGPLVIGRGKWTGQLNHYFPGAIKDVRIWDRVVQASELQTLAKPLAPTITLPGGPIARVGQPVQVTLSAGGDINVTSYKYSLDDPALATPSTATPASPGGPVTVTVTASTVDIHTVYAVAVDGLGRSSAVASQDIQVDDVPGAPTGVTASAGPGQATVSWTPPTTDGGSAITGYTVTASPGGATVSVDGGTTTATVTGLANGTVYTFTVTATNAVGTGPTSAPSNSVTPLTVPGAPTGVTAVAGNAQATVSWTAPGLTGGSPITGYTVTASPGGQTVSVNGSTTTATVTGLANGTAYTFTVKATNAVGAGPASVASNSVTPTSPATVPGAPTGVMAWPGNTQANVSWTPPVSNGGSPITGYTVTASPGGLTVSVGGSATNALVTGLINGTVYTFTVTANNAVGASPASAPSNSVTPANVPGAPTGVTAAAGNGQATVSWTAPTSNGGSPITGYTVTASPGGQTATVGAAPTSATMTGLTNGTSYTFTVTATNAIGSSIASAPSNGVAPSAGARFIQQASASGLPQSATFASNVTTGNRIVVVVASWNDANQLLTSVWDSAGNTYTEVADKVLPDGTEGSVWTAVVTAGGGTALAVNTSAWSATLIAVEYSGLSTASGTAAVDQSALATGSLSGMGTVASGPTGATTASNELVVGAYASLWSQTPATYGSGWTGRASVTPSSSGTQVLVEDQVVALGAMPNATAVVGVAGQNTNWLLATLVFKLAS